MTILWAVLISCAVINAELFVVVLLIPRISRWAMRKAMAKPSKLKVAAPVSGLVYSAAATTNQPKSVTRP